MERERGTKPVPLKLDHVYSSVSLVLNRVYKQEDTFNFSKDEKKILNDQTTLVVHGFAPDLNNKWVNLIVWALTVVGIMSPKFYNIKPVEPKKNDN